MSRLLAIWSAGFAAVDHPSFAAALGTECSARCPEDVREPLVFQSGEIWTADGFPDAGTVGHRIRMACSPEDVGSAKSRSPWHSIPYRAGPDTFHFVCEVPRGTCAQRKVMSRKVGNPLMQDVIDGLPSYAPLGRYPFSVGIIPQTWESPYERTDIMGLVGTGDPVDALLISDYVCTPGEVLTVKLISSLGMQYRNKRDWKMLAYLADAPEPGLTKERLDEVQLFWQSLEDYDCRSSDFAAQLGGGVGDASADSCRPELYKVDWLAQGGFSEPAGWQGSCAHRDAGVAFENFSSTSLRLTTPVGHDLYISALEGEEHVEAAHGHWLRLVGGGYAGMRDIEDGTWEFADAREGPLSGICMANLYCVCPVAAEAAALEADEAEVVAASGSGVWVATVGAGALLVISVLCFAGKRFASPAQLWRRLASGRQGKSATNTKSVEVTAAAQA